MNLSFAGCGFLGIYHIGVVSCFHEYGPNLVKFLAGTSAGAMAACCFICDCSLGQITSDALKVAITARNYTLGPFHPKFDVTRLMQEHLGEILPDNAHTLCSGRLRISVTRVSDGKNVILDQFNSKQELIVALQCSCFIPIVSGIIPPEFRGIRYIDGCYSDNLPIYDRNTVTVSPFCGQSDICPRDNSFNLLQMNLANTSIDLSTTNIYRFMRVLFPPNPDILSKMCKQGFEDALHFLQKNDLISCARCIAINSTLQLRKSDGSSTPTSHSESDDDELSSDDENCTECKRRQQRALLDDLPEAVLSVFEEACSSVNKGIFSWIFKNKSMRILSVLTLPYVLPIEIGYVVLTRFLELVPKFGRDVTRIIESLVDYARGILTRFNKNRHFYSAKFSCQLAITEYDYDADDGYVSNPIIRPVSPQLCRRHNSLVSSSEDVVATKRISNQTPDSRVLGTMNFGFRVDLQSACKASAASSSEASCRPLMKAHGADWHEEKVIDIANAALHWDSRKAEIWDSQVDTFDNILEVTRRQDALMAFYYLDHKNRLKVTEIFDVADADLSAGERENNRQMLRSEEMWISSRKTSSSFNRSIDTSSSDEIFNGFLHLTDDDGDDDDEGLTRTYSAGGRALPKARKESVVIIHQ